MPIPAIVASVGTLIWKGVKAYFTIRGAIKVATFVFSMKQTIDLINKAVDAGHRGRALALLKKYEKQELELAKIADKAKNRRAPKSAKTLVDFDEITKELKFGGE